MNHDPARRGVLRMAGLGLSVMATGPSLLSMSAPVRAAPLTTLGPLLPPDGNGVRLPAGFRSRVVAWSGFPVRTGPNRWLRHRWHIFPDGGATFPTSDGGWIYVSNSESPGFLDGGAGALRFAADGSIVDAYTVLSGTMTRTAPVERLRGAPGCRARRSPSARSTNATSRGADRCAATRSDTSSTRPPPWTPASGQVYLTEDEPDGCLYRFVPDRFRADGWPDLDVGTLQVAVLDAQSSTLSWAQVPDPRPRFHERPTRRQVDAAARFDGGEGCFHADGGVYFTTKGTDQVWRLDIATQTLQVIYDRGTSAEPILSGVDNVTVSSGGDVLVAEDGGDMQIVVVGADGTIAPLLQIPGQPDSEIAGPAFSPDGSRLYFSSQRGNPFGSDEGPGITYEVSGPFGPTTS